MNVFGGILESAGLSICVQNTCFYQSTGGSIKSLFGRALVNSLKEDFVIIVGKLESVGNQHFLLFPQCFLSFPKQISIFESYLSRQLEILSA